MYTYIDTCHNAYIGIGLNKRTKQMEKRCEFCKVLKATVYCKSDAAYLCLSCDTKVHSANALSFRHPRTLVCESCNYHPAVFRCSVHRMFVCQICDDVIHRRDDVGGFQHQKKVLGCYMGCPSAKDLASLWGFDFNDLENNNSIECQGGSSSRGTKVVVDDKRGKNSFSILQQILYLEKLQLSDEIDDPHLVHVKEHKTINNNSNNNNNNTLDHFDGNLEFRQTEESLEEKNDERLLSPFSQLEDHLTSSNGNHLSFWQYKSPAHNNNEIWLQNMQDIGVCDEVQCLDDDDVIIPDVDLTFRNFEELFGSEHEPSLKFDQDPSYGMLEYQGHDWISPTFYDQQLLPHGSSYNSKKSNLHGNGNVILRNKEKKVLRHEKQACYTCPKSKSEVKKRGKGEVY